MLLRFFTLLTFLLVSITGFSQTIEGIQFGEEEQKSNFVEHDGIIFQVIPVEDEATEKACGVMYIPVNKETMIPTTLKAKHVRSFEKAMEKEYEISLDSVLHYNEDATLKFAIEKEEGIEYEFNKEMMGNEYDTFFVIWNRKLSVDIKSDNYRSR